MEIIKHGDVKQQFEVTCYNCGCEFVADRSETYTIATPIVLAARYSREPRKFRYCDCPDCKNMIMIEEVDMASNSINQKSEVNNIPEYAETYDNGIIGCQRIENLPEISEDVLKENMVTPKEIMDAYNGIERRRYEDNLPWCKKLFRKKSLILLGVFMIVSMCSCVTHTLTDEYGVVTSVENLGVKSEIKYRVTVTGIDHSSMFGRFKFQTNTLYQVGDTIVIGRPSMKNTICDTLQ